LTEKQEELVAQNTCNEVALSAVTEGEHCIRFGCSPSLILLYSPDYVSPNIHYPLSFYVVGLSLTQ